MVVCEEWGSVSESLNDLLGLNGGDIRAAWLRSSTELASDYMRPAERPKRQKLQTFVCLLTWSMEYAME